MKNLKTPLKWTEWTWFLGIAWIAGVLLRMTFVHDMEYKEDEEYNFIQSQLIGNSQPWPWYGIASGVYIVNPGMSIWVFAVLAKLFGIHSPTGLAHAVQAFAILGMSLILPFAFKFLRAPERKIWLWAFALAMVNPFLVYYHRKLWPEGFLPFFTLLTLMGWWRKERFWGAFVWGWVGAWLGQIHMSGFFFSAALFLWTLLPKRTETETEPAPDQPPPRTNWKSWLLGSVLGSLPLIPWLLYTLQNPVSHAITSGWAEIVQLKYWVFWITDPLGLHLGNPIGVQRGPSQWDQISDFARYPLLFGQATYLVGLAHLGAILAGFGIFSSALKRLYEQWRSGKGIQGPKDKTAFVVNATFLGCGVLLTATGVMIRRYYMAVTFPLEYIFLTRLADPERRSGRNLLILLWICELFISAHFVGYIHVNGGSERGDYGTSYRLVHPGVD